MQTVLIIIFIGLLGGMAVGVQAPLSSMITQRLGVMESVFIVHIGGALAALVPLIYFGGGKLGNWRSVPWYALAAGVFGLVVIFSMSYMIPRIGVATALIILLAGQLVIGTILDHFGLLGASVRPIDGSRVIGLSVVLLGVWLSVK
ncbi:MAG: DMT family transporter [Anaerolineales bacterium]|nr:DMT family transporter [Anaerolineales bacterium]